MILFDGLDRPQKADSPELEAAWLREARNGIEKARIKSVQNDPPTTWVVNEEAAVSNVVFCVSF